MLRDWLGGAEGKAMKSLRRKAGTILQLKGKKVAAFRDERGSHALSSFWAMGKYLS